MEKRPQLSIIIVNYRSSDYIKQCINSLQEQISSIDHEIIIVNNDPAERDFSFVSAGKIIQQEHNVGFGTACNVGSKHSSGEILFFLNPDTTFELGKISAAIDHMKSNKLIGIMGLQLTDSSGEKELDNYGKKITPLKIIIGNIFPKKHIPITKSKNVDWVSGGAMLVKKYAFEKINGFDENFFMYYEDVDLCLRASKLGFSIIFWPEISFRHASGKSFENVRKQKELYYQSQHYYFKKHFGPILAIFIDILRKLTHHKGY